jgi:hypothetical protein
VQVPTSTPPSISVATSTKSAIGRRHESKQRNIRRHVTTRRSIGWKLVDIVFDPTLHARFDFILKTCTYDEGLFSHGDLPHYLPSDSVLERDMGGERVFFNPHWELAKQMASHVDNCRRTTPAMAMAALVLPKWAKFNTITRQLKLYL